MQAGFTEISKALNNLAQATLQQQKQPVETQAQSTQQSLPSIQTEDKISKYIPNQTTKQIQNLEVIDQLIHKMET